MTIKELQAELTTLGVEYPEKAKKAELEALVAGAHGDPTGTPHLLTQEDFDENPEGFGDDVKVGDLIIIPAANMTAEEGEAAQAAAEAEAQPEETPTPPAPEGDQEVTVLNPLRHNGEYYAPGTTIVLTAAEAAAMRADGTVA